MRILFLSRTNNGMAQMAEGLTRHMLGDHVTVTSAIASDSHLAKFAGEAMREINIDISPLQALPLASIDTHTFDYVVSIAERDLSDGIPQNVKRMHWPLVSPFDPPAAEVELRQRMRDVRTALSKHIKALSRMQPQSVSKPRA